MRRSSLAQGMVAAALTVAMLAGLVSEVRALIVGGVGNEPMRDPGWPQGAAAVFNVQERIAFWEGPPFGGGQYHAECRGDVKALNAVLADFAKIDAKTKRVVIQDGVGHSFWLAPNREPGKLANAKIDWRFMVWMPKNWEMLRKLPPDFNPTGPQDKDDGPPVEIEIFTGGDIRFEDIVMPQGVTVIDNRLVAHGFRPADGSVLEGSVVDLADGKPLPAKARIERYERNENGESSYVAAADTIADAKGRWIIKKAPAGDFRVVVESDGYVPRIAGHVRVEEEPRWKKLDTALSKPGPVTGKVVDEAGQPLEGVEVSLRNVTAAGAKYEVAIGTSTKTGPGGRFRIDTAPIGTASVWVHKPGYVRPGLGSDFATPKNGIEETMKKGAKIVVTVAFPNNNRPGGYIVRIAPEGGEGVGKYGGSGNINEGNQITFDFVPPGRYTLRGRPNPSSDDQETQPITIDAKGGATTEVTITAK
jgi:hypothetical protein